MSRMVPRVGIPPAGTAVAVPTVEEIERVLLEVF